jgi:hypothetical protein
MFFYILFFVSVKGASYWDKKLMGDIDDLYRNDIKLVTINELKLLSFIIQLNPCEHIKKSSKATEPLLWLYFERCLQKAEGS